ncbi:MAG TPA: cyclic nucleotide-binding domain-containing protein [bacterium]|nr:cyclic nucleotide-binding domain-containing protein [bacterium]
MAKIKPLKASPYLKGFNNQEIATLSAIVEERELEPGAPIAEENQESEGLVIVAKGSLTLKTALPDGSAREVLTLEEGKSFGELSLVGEGPRMVSANAGARGARVLVIARGDFEKLLKSNPRVAAKFLQGILREIGAVARASSAQIKKLLAATR